MRSISIVSPCCWAVSGDASGGADVICGDRVPDVEQRERLLHLPRLRELLGHALEEGRALDVGRFLVPGVKDSLGRLELVPTLVPGRDLGVDLLEHGGDDVLLLHGLDVRSGRPDVAEEDGLVVGVVAEGLGFKIDVNAT